MRFEIAPRFFADARALDTEGRARLFDVVLDLSRVLGSPHLHAGIGLRKVHPSGICEARIGLSLQLVFAVKKDLVSFVRVGTHDEIRKYLRSL